LANTRHQSEIPLRICLLIIFLRLIAGICQLKELMEQLQRNLSIKVNKLFIDRKEILSVLGGKPGRYHGFQNDK